MFWKIAPNDITVSMTRKVTQVTPVDLEQINVLIQQTNRRYVTLIFNSKGLMLAMKLFWLF